MGSLIPHAEMPAIPFEGGQPADDAALQRTRRKRSDLSSLATAADGWLGAAGFDRGPWLTVAFAGGIAAWFILASPWQWLGLMSALALAAIAALALWREHDERAHLRLAVAGMALAALLGTAAIWTRSDMVGARALERPAVTVIDGRILKREEQPAQGRVRLTLAYRDAAAGIARKVRVNLPAERDAPGISEGAVVRLRARLMPPAPPMLPGSYDFARAAWFQGLAATGSVLGPVEMIAPATGDAGWVARQQRRLANHVMAQLPGSSGAIAAAFASGHRGGIAESDESAMRDSGLTHLLSISGLHVSAVIAATYALAIRILALWPWLVLRVRLPVAAAMAGAMAGVGYTLLTGAEVPTVRSCIGALLVLFAMVLGREPLSLRMVAVGGAAVLMLWPESLVGASFQMSFAAVLAIVTLHQSAPVRRFLAPREERWPARQGRRFVMLLITGIVIELALMPIVLFHFHRAGLYGAFANVLAIPLVTFIAMPLIALALMLDVAGLGAPAWWAAGQSLDALLWLARWTAGQAGAVKLMPDMGRGIFALFVAGGLWLALWRGRIRLLGLVPVLGATLLLATKPAPDILISGDGRHVGIAGEGGRLLVLREGRSDYARENLQELAGMSGEVVPLANWSKAQCSRDFCSLPLVRDGREWWLLIGRSRERVEERALATACERADIVVANRWLPRSCAPRWLKADRAFLGQSGGLAITLSSGRVDKVADTQGDHGWWRAGERTPYPVRPRPYGTTTGPPAEVPTPAVRTTLPASAR